jgi:shikimate 5-dehydrogenase
MIDKDTIICGSIAATAGNFGCSIHNAAFQHHKLNYIYKSFSISSKDLKDVIPAMKLLNIRGLGVTMPHKIDILKYVDEISPEVQEIGATNTIVNDYGVIKAYNTDAYSSYTVMRDFEDLYNEIYILGNGGYSKAVAYSAGKIFKNINFITRSNWSRIATLKNALVFNCTPLETVNLHSSNQFINCNIKSETGQKLALLQASKQYFLYTGEYFPINYIQNNFNAILLKGRKYYESTLL